MRHLFRSVSVAALAVAFGIAATGNASAQTRLPQVRVVSDTADVLIRPSAVSDVLTRLHQGTLVEALDRTDDWYWVVLPPDLHGTRIPGWIHAGDVALVSGGDDDAVLRHFGEATQAANTRDRELQAKQQAEAQVRLDRAKRRVEEARRKYDAVAGRAAHESEPVTPEGTGSTAKTPKR